MAPKTQFNPKVWRKFTIVEVMIVVAIVTLLAAIAIPQWAEYQLRAKRAELEVNVPSIRDATIAYLSTATPAGFAFEWNPDASLVGKETNPWGVSQWTSTWSQFGWGPDGEVRGSYKVTFTAGRDGAHIEGVSDLDASCPGSSLFACGNSYYAQYFARHNYLGDEYRLKQMSNVDVY